jgi:methyl-accepting chemotaxis protein
MELIGLIRRRLAIRIAIQVIFVVLIMSAGFVWLQTVNAKNTAVRVITAHGEHIGESYAKFIDVGQLERFLGQFAEAFPNYIDQGKVMEPEELEASSPGLGETYRAIRGQLDRFRTEIGALYVYIYRYDEENHAFIMIDGQPPGSDAASPVNEETDIDAEDTALLLAGRPASSSIVDDEAYGLYASSYVPIKRADGSLVAVLGIDIEASLVEAIAGDIVRDSVPYFALMIVFALLGTGIVVWAIVRALRPLRRMVAGAEKIAAGDFQTANRLLRETPVRSLNEIGAMYRVMANMSDSLSALVRGMVSDVARIADRLVGASESLAKESGELLDWSARVREAADLVADGTTTQRASSEESARAMEEAAASIQRITEASVVVAEAADQALGSAETGREMIESLNGQIRAVSAATEDAVWRTEQLRSRSNEIGEAIAGISRVADQTKLLALNAAIEASRAGEHGAGFAVVAREVRKLAEEAAVLTERVAALLGDIRNESERISEAMLRNSVEVKMGEEQSGRLREAFADIVEKFRMVSRHIQDISAAAVELSAGAEEVAASVSEIARIARGSNEQALQIREQTEKQQQSARRVADAASELNAAVRRLRDSVQNIRI